MFRVERHKKQPRGSLESTQPTVHASVPGYVHAVLVRCCQLAVLVRCCQLRAPQSQKQWQLLRLETPATKMPHSSLRAAVVLLLVILKEQPSSSAPLNGKVSACFKKKKMSPVHSAFPGLLQDKI